MVAVPQRPNDVPEFRAELIAYCTDGRLESADRMIRVSADNDWEYEEDRASWVGTVPAQLVNSEMYWMGADVLDLAEAVSADLPMDTSLSPEMLGSPFGLVVFERPFLTRGADPDDLWPIIAMSWGPTVSMSEGWSFQLLVWTPIGSSVAYNGMTGWNEGVDLGDIAPQALPDWRLLVTLLALSKSPGVATETAAEPDRPARRRLQRAEMPLDATRVIYLKGASAGSEHRGTSSYHHRWIVKGHWRSQPYGPGKRYRKPVFIAPHIKGPEGAPLLTGDKVTAFVTPPKEQ